MSFDGLLIHAGTIQRATVNSAGDNNEPVETWATLSSPRCRVDPRGGKEMRVDNQVVISTHVGFLPDTDVTEKDRLVVSGDTYNILLVRRIPGASGTHHVECDLELLRV